MAFAAPGISSSSASSLIGESSNPQRKNKRFVKKKGETRKRNSMELNSQLQFVKESYQIDEISKKMENVTMKIEGDADSAVITKKNIDTSTLSNFGGKKFEKFTDNEEKKVTNGLEMNAIKSANENNEDKEDVEGYSAEATDQKGQETALIVDKSVKNEEPEKDETNYKSLLKDFDKGKTDEEKKRDRQNARFAEAVARFSVKFTKAAIELGIIRPNEGSSWSDSSSSSTDSCSSSCSCSDCCTTDYSTCSCSDCRSSSSSSSSSFSSSPTTSCSTPNSSTSSCSTVTTTSSNSEIMSPETFVEVKKKFK